MSAKKPASADPFDRLVDAVLGGGGHHAVWGQHHRAALRGFDERRFKKALRDYWGADADNMRIALAVQDATFVAGVAATVADALQLDVAGRRRVASAMVRRRVLGEPDPTFDGVDAAWRAWWPPPPGDEGRERFATFVRAWRVWLEETAP